MAVTPRFCSSQTCQSHSSFLKVCSLGGRKEWLVNMMDRNNSTKSVPSNLCLSFIEPARVEFR